MKDFNFFSYLIKEKKNRNLMYLNLVLVVGGFVLAMIVIYLVNFGVIQKLNYDIEDRKTSIDYKESEELENIIEAKRRELEILKEYEDIVAGIDDIITSQDTINSSLLSKISSTVPEGVKFTSINIINNALSITGTSSSRISIGELEYNIKELGMFNLVHIGNITFDGTSYSFGVNCIMKEAQDNEDNN